MEPAVMKTYEYNCDVGGRGNKENSISKSVSYLEVTKASEV